MLFYISDTHFGHKNILKYEKRPYQDLDEMTYDMIQRWNKTVTPNDTVYVLGDFSFYNYISTMYIARQLNGNIEFIAGNHDEWSKRLALPTYLEVKDSGNDVILCHYPLERWNKQEYGSIHIHGHIHDMTDCISKKANRYNCSCILHDLKPVTLQQLISGKE